MNLGGVELDKVERGEKSSDGGEVVIESRVEDVYEYVGYYGLCK